MDTGSAKTIAVVRGSEGIAPHVLLRQFVERWRSSTRIAGVLEEGHGLPDRSCGAGVLRSIATGARYPLFQELGPKSISCNLDGTGAAAASESICREIAAGCDLVVLSKFAKLESQRSGLLSAYRAAIEARIPVLTSVSSRFDEAWEKFAAPLYVDLPADEMALDSWWRAQRASSGETL